MKDGVKQDSADSRRRFLKQCFMGGCGIALGGYAFRDFFGEETAEGDVGARSDSTLGALAALPQWSKEADWYEVSGPKLSPIVQCTLCPNECVLAEGERGSCRVRETRDGKLHTLVYGNPCAVHVDPVEKKPLYHFLPASSILSIATAGCNLHCLNCQNWEISQSKPEETRNRDLSPQNLVNIATSKGISSIAYTYSEPIVFYEYTYDSAKRARVKGVRNVLVTAGYINSEPLKKLCRVADAANVDLKAFNDTFYKKVTRSTLAPVLESLKIMRAEGVWVEVTRLIVPTLSDDLEDIRRMVGWMLENLGPDTPLHFSRFHAAYRLQSLSATPLDVLDSAREMAEEEGLHHVYIGNAASRFQQDTFCPKCRKPVIERRGYRVLSNSLTGGRCPCGEKIAGVWS